MTAVSLGNPAPLGLLAFGMTTALLMYVEMGWISVDFEYQFYGTAMWLGGVGQLLVAIFELIKGSSFSFAVFGVYGAFWLAWASVFEERASETSAFADYKSASGSAAFFAQWGMLTLCFWILTWRKNICLIVIFALLSITFFLLSAAADTGDEAVKKIAGYFGFATALGALYTGVAELINEEYGRHLLPGLAPMHTPERIVITQELVESKLSSYDPKTNTLLLHFRGLQIKTKEDIQAIRSGVEAKIKAAEPPNGKIHAVVDYKDAAIKDDLVHEYWDMVAQLQRQYYLSARRFGTEAFGTHQQGVVNGMTKVNDSIPK